MNVAEAIAAFRRRWDHPALDPRDVEERLALRLQDLPDPPRLHVMATPPACRLFWLLEDDEDARRRRWTSAYVHDSGDVDEVLDRLRPSSWDEAHGALERGHAA